MSDSLHRLYEIVTRLRGPGGCPWDREQTAASLRSSLLEESHEAVEAIDLADDTLLREELGDLLLVIYLQTRIAEERGAFSLEDVAAGACEKMIRRHPHVFGVAEAEDSAAVLRQWEMIKRSEKGAQASLMDGISRALPGLLRAQTVQKKAARIGFDWPDASGARRKVEEEWLDLSESIERRASQDSVREIEEELGDFFFAAVNYARKLGCDAETVLAAATGKFIRRFQQVEAEVTQRGLAVEALSLPELDAMWDDVKKKEKAGRGEATGTSNPTAPKAPTAQASQFG